MQWQPDGLAIPANKWFLGAEFPGAPPISLKSADGGSGGVKSAGAVDCALPPCSEHESGLRSTAGTPETARVASEEAIASREEHHRTPSILPLEVSCYVFV